MDVERSIVFMPKIAGTLTVVFVANAYKNKGNKCMMPLKKCFKRHSLFGGNDCVNKTQYIYPFVSFGKTKIDVEAQGRIK